MEKEMFYGLQFLFTKTASGRIYFFKRLKAVSCFCTDKILFNVLYWNSLNLVSNVVLKGSRYIFSQSTGLRCVRAESFVIFLLRCWFTGYFKTVI